MSSGTRATDVAVKVPARNWIRIAMGAFDTPPAPDRLPGACHCGRNGVNVVMPSAQR